MPRTAHTTYHLCSIRAVLSYDPYTDEEYTKLLHSPPILGTFDEMAIIADALTANIDSCQGINYDSATCHGCENCVFDRWVPYHPEFKCKVGGKMDPWTQDTIECPCPLKAQDELDRLGVSV